ncbi:MAG: putative transport system ATP-binding protein [Patescibacteria group bacterium]|nr:putative transport system ATP-binding protein [Patescibacteria group bacterium]
MIEVKNVTKTYGKKDNLFTALYNVNFTIPDGSTVAIIGKSGSGKSTLMHVMSGLDSPSNGEIKIDGKSLQSLKPKAVDAFRSKEMSFIFQSFFIEANQTCYQNVMLPLEIAKVGRRDRRKRVVEALNAVELGDKIDNPANNLSGGQKQRLAIARAIVNKPKLIFADEPTGNLDSSTGEKVIDLLFSLNKKLGCTLVIVTHDHELANRCKTQIYMKDGEVQEIKTKGKK